MELYPWVILLHIVGAFIFAASHGVAIWMALQISRSLRAAIGIKSEYGPKDAPDPVPLPDAEVVALAARSPVGILSGVGSGGLVIILWLMVVKPF